MGPRTQKVRKLSGLEIDEVSLVDRPANQHGVVAFAKRDEENQMDPIFDAEGDEVDPSTLQHGDVVYTDPVGGEELVFVADGEPGEGLGEVDDGQYDEGEQYQVDDRQFEDAGVGKSLFPLSGSKVKAAGRLARSEVGGKARGARNAVTSTRARGWATAGGMQGRALASNRAVQAGAGGAAVAGGAGYVGGRRREVGKSFGEEVRVALSKALTADEQADVIAKALDQVGVIAQQNAELQEMVGALIEDRELDDYGEIAKGYEGLPVDPQEFGGILHRVADVLEPDQLATLDRVFKAAGDAGLYEELGYGGPGSPAGANEVLEQVYALAGQTVGKSQGGISPEQAVTAIFEANPAAYDEYEAQQRGLR